MLLHNDFQGWAVSLGCLSEFIRVRIVGICLISLQFVVILPPPLFFFLHTRLPSTFLLQTIYQTVDSCSRTVVFCTVCTGNVNSIFTGSWEKGRNWYWTTRIIRPFEFSSVMQSEWFKISITKMILKILRTLISLLLKWRFSLLDLRNCFSFVLVSFCCLEQYGIVQVITNCFVFFFLLHYLI